MSYRYAHVLRVGTTQEQPEKALFHPCGSFPAIFQLNSLVDNLFSSPQRDDSFGNFKELNNDSESRSFRVGSAAKKRHSGFLQQIPENFFSFGRRSHSSGIGSNTQNISEKSKASGNQK
jgi:hypothetical protein